VGESELKKGINNEENDMGARRHPDYLRLFYVDGLLRIEMERV
jgi:hypothetical protein